MIKTFTQKKNMFNLYISRLAYEDHPTYTGRICNTTKDRIHVNLKLGWCNALFNSEVTIPGIVGIDVIDTDVKVAHLLEKISCREIDVLERIKDGKMLQILMVSSNNNVFNTPSNHMYNINGNFLLGGQELNYTIQLDTFCNNAIRCENIIMCNVLIAKSFMAKCMRVFLEVTHSVQGLCIIEFL